MKSSTEKKEIVKRNIIVIGASAGGIEAILEVTKGLPKDIPAAIFVVHHLPPYAKSKLHILINFQKNVPAVTARNGQVFEMGKIYCAVADHHMLLEKGKIVLSKGPRENRFRPSIDALFRSAAYEYKEQVIGVVLSGALNDGTAGMYSIKRFGGLAIIQEPADATFDSMPVSVANFVETNHALPASDIGHLLGHLSSEWVNKKEIKVPESDELIELEVNIAKNHNALNAGVFEKGVYSPLACPDCKGALVRYEEGPLIRFRCHTGHSYTPEALLYGISENINDDLWKVMRGMEENNFVLRLLGKKLKEKGQEDKAAAFFKEAQVLIEKSRKIANIVEGVDIISKETVL